MRFQVPQFIEHEAKIVGPLTLKQSAYLLGPIVISFVLFFALPFPLFVVAAILIQAIGLAFNFIKVGKKSLPEILWDALFFFIAPQSYIWTRGKHKVVLKQGQEYTNLLEGTLPEATRISRGSKLRDLSLRVETKK